MNAGLETRTFDTDDGQATRAAIGVVVLQTDETIEHDLREMVPSDGVRTYVNRISSEPDVTEETLRTMEAALPAAAGQFPEAVSFDVLGYGCTSASLVIGEDRVSSLLTESHPGVPATNPFTALKAACQALGIRRLSVVSPYVHELSRALRDGLEEFGVGVPKIVSFGVREERVVARISPESILRALEAAGSEPESDAVFASCTNLRAAGVIGRAEERLSKPVLSSNQVLTWHMLRLAGLNDAVPGFGRLFQCGRGIAA
ncbi:MAG: Asp/Glu racemase [Rhodospirillales bacterium]